MEISKLIFEDYESVIYSKEKYFEILGVDSADFAKIKISYLNLSRRSENVLYGLSLSTVEDILKLYPYQLACSNGCGRKVFNEINVCLFQVSKDKGIVEKNISAIKEDDEAYAFFKLLGDRLITFDINQIKKFGVFEEISVTTIELGIAFEEFIENFIISERQKDIMRKRFKIDILPKCTLEEISQGYNISRERVRQIINKGLNRISLLNKTPSKTRYFKQVKDILINFEVHEIYRIISIDILDIYNIHFVTGLLCSLFGRKNANIILDNIKKIHINKKEYDTFIMKQNEVCINNEKERERLRNLICYPSEMQTFAGSVNKLPQLREINEFSGFNTGYIFLNKARVDIPFESGAERQVLKYLDYNSYVSEINAQCVCIPYAENRNYFPDIVIKTEDNTICIVEVKPFCKMALYENLLKFEALHSYCKEKKIGYLVVDERMNSIYQYKNSISNVKLEKLILDELDVNETIDYTRYKSLLVLNGITVTFKELSVVVVKNNLKWSIRPFSIRK